MAGKSELVGDQQALSHKPTSSPSAKGPHGQVEVIGDQVALNRTPVIPPTTTPHMGQVQLVGDQAPLGRTPVQGWGSAANLPMADDPKTGSRVGPGGGKRK